MLFLLPNLTEGPRGEETSPLSFSFFLLLGRRDKPTNIHRRLSFLMDQYKYQRKRHSGRPGLVRSSLHKLHAALTLLEPDRGDDEGDLPETFSSLDSFFSSCFSSSLFIILSVKGSVNKWEFQYKRFGKSYFYYKDEK